MAGGGHCVDGRSETIVGESRWLAARDEEVARCSRRVLEKGRWSKRWHEDALAGVLACVDAVGAELLRWGRGDEALGRGGSLLS